ncbi:MAG: SMP-30/gluconolactonase/LRE family protein [Candidatus Omnitrophota bacterium]|nr:MAG: SMP-30/gluconolactonase/LRE family protein [Candidatus Omnitrophota bacterium]
MVFVIASVAGSENDAASDLLASEVKKLANGFKFTEGPVWHKDGYLLFSDIPSNHIVKWIRDGGASVWRELSGNSNGLTFDREGRLIACEHGNRRVTRTEKDGTITVIADQFKGKRLNSPNDCVVRSDGMIFFTDPPYGIGRQEREQPCNGVYRVIPGNEPVLLVDDFQMPNGIAFSSDESILYIADSSDKNHVRKFQVEKDGTLGNGEIFAEIGTPDGIKVDDNGNLYATSNEGVVVFNPSGERIATIDVPEQPANCAFGGKENTFLFITARTGLYAVQLKVAGAPVWK